MVGRSSASSLPRRDVFLTSYLPAVRAKLGIDLEDIRAVNPNIIYVRGSGYGPLGARCRSAGLRRGVVLVTGWGRRGVDATGAASPRGSRPAFGDLMGA